MIKISVIVPVYNIEKYVSRCLDSVLAQSLKDIELICVNDGSTDNSLKILQQYRKSDRRVKIIDKENGGLSSARNAAVRAARGKYTLFVDGDDKISTVACERLFNYAEKHEADVVLYECITEDLKNNIKNLVSSSFLKENYTDNVFSIETLEPDMFPNIIETAWSKLYRTDLIKHIPFYEDMILEDVPFEAEVYVKAKRIVYFPEALYYYYLYREGSIMQLMDEKHFDVFKACERRDKAFIDSGYWDKYKHTLDRISARDQIRTLGLLREDLRESFYNKIKESPMQLDYDYYKGIAMSGIDRQNLEIYKAILELSYDEFSKRYTMVMNYG